MTLKIATDQAVVLDTVIVTMTGGLEDWKWLHQQLSGLKLSNLDWN